VSGDRQLAAAREFLDSVSRRPAAGLPPSVLAREDAELRRQLGQVLDVAGEATAVAGLLCDAVAAVVYELDLGEAALVVDALEVAAEYRRYRADLSCDLCSLSAAGVCDGHAADIERAAEYDALADQIREPGL